MDELAEREKVSERTRSEAMMGVEREEAELRRRKAVRE